MYIAESDILQNRKPLDKEINDTRSVITTGNKKKKKNQGGRAEADRHVKYLTRLATGSTGKTLGMASAAPHSEDQTGGCRWPVQYKCWSNPPPMKAHQEESLNQES